MKKLLLALLLIPNIVLAGEVNYIYCKDKFLGLEVISDDGISVMGSPGSLIHNEHIRDFILDVDKTATQHSVDICTKKDESKTTL